MKIEEIMATEYHRVAIDGLTDSGEDAMRYVIAALEQARFQIVPVEPSMSMYMAGKNAIKEAKELKIHSEAAWCYSAMLAQAKMEMNNG